MVMLVAAHVSVISGDILFRSPPFMMAEIAHSRSYVKKRMTSVFIVKSGKVNELS